jgi:solute:Na+ symporter, SSS family
VTRWTTVASGAFGTALAIVVPSVSGALTIFYTLLSVSLFVPVLAGLYARRSGTAEALAAIGAGVALVLASQLWKGGQPIGGWTPAMIGLVAAAAAWLVVRTTPLGARTRPATAG